MADRSFSHAIAEGDGISVIAAVEDAEAARAAESQRAEALVVRGDPTSIRAASALPILWRAPVDLERAAASADAVMLVFDSLDDDDGRLEQLHQRALALGLDCAVEVRDEEELEQALDRVDPEIFLLSPVEREDDETQLRGRARSARRRPGGEARDRRSAADDAARGQRARARRLRRRDRARARRARPGRRAASVPGLAPCRRRGTALPFR